MSGAGTGYDLYPTTYNPEGRLFQVDYAVKATENGSTVVGIRCRDGVVLGAIKNVLSMMIVEGSNSHLFGIGKHSGAVCTGVMPDAKALIARARQEAAQYLEWYGKEITAKVLSDRVAQYVHAHTLYWAVRPFGSSVILTGFDNGQPRLYMIEPSGNYFEYLSCAAGKGSQQCKTEIDKLDLPNLTVDSALYQITKMLIKSREEGSEKRTEIELAWFCESNNYQFTPVPKDIVHAVEERARKDIEAEEMGGD